MNKKGVVGIESLKMFRFHECFIIAIIIMFFQA